MTRILSISGSLRKASTNTALLRAAESLAPEGTCFSTASIADIPHYNAELDVDGGPPSVRTFKEQITAADGLLIATPEYNYGIPGVLKNAIDWASRPAYKSVLAGKPVAIVGASGSVVGSARAQGQLKQVLLGTISNVFPYPELLVGKAHERIRDGELVDEKSRELLAKMLAAYVDWLDS